MWFADDTVPAEMANGSVLFYSGSLYHGAGANRSDATRFGLNITYNVAWLRQEENQYLSVPRDVAATLPIDLLRLMGTTAVRTRSATSTTCATRSRPSGPVRDDGLRRRPAARCRLPAPCDQSVAPGNATVGAVPVDIRMAWADDYDDLFMAFSRLVARGGISPGPPGLARGIRRILVDHFDRAVASFGGYLIGGYYIKPNFVGRAAPSPTVATSCTPPTGTGVGRPWSSTPWGGSAAGLRRHAIQPGLRIEPRPGHVPAAGLQEVGRIPHAVEGEDPWIYWRSLEDITP